MTRNLITVLVTSASNKQHTGDDNTGDDIMTPAETTTQTVIVDKSVIVCGGVNLGVICHGMTAVNMGICTVRFPMSPRHIL